MAGRVLDKLFSPFTGGSGRSVAQVDGGKVSRIETYREYPPIPHCVGTSPRKRGEESRL